MVNCFALATQKANLVQKPRHSVQLNQINDVVLLCKSLEGQLKLLVLVDSATTGLGLVAAAEQTAAVSAQSVLDHVREIVYGKLLLALKLVSVSLLVIRE